MHAIPSSQSASPPSSIWPLQLSSTPLQISVPDLSTWTVALPSTSGALVAKAVAVFVKSSLLQAGVASAVISIVTLEPMGSVSTLTSSGFVLITDQVTLVSFDVTVTVTFVM